jgi:TBC1 domain family member 20
MLPSFSGAFAHLHLILPLLQTVDPALSRLLKNTVQRTQSAPFWALAATITLYAHDITSYGQIARLFDFLIAKEAVASIYLFAAIIIGRKDELLEIPPDEPEMLHFTLSKLPTPLNLESLIDSAVRLLAEHPPHTLPGGAWSRVSKNSVLKTTVPPTQVCTQSEDMAKERFDAHAREIRRREALEKTWKGFRRGLYRHRLLVRSTGLAVVVGVVALLLGKYTTSSTVQGVLGIGGGILGRALSSFQLLRD